MLVLGVDEYLRTLSNLGGGWVVGRSGSYGLFTSEPRTITVAADVPTP